MQRGTQRSAISIQRSAKGFTLIEVLVAVALVALGILVMLPVFGVSANSIVVGKEITVGSTLAQDLMERLTGSPVYNSVLTGTTLVCDACGDPAGDGTAPWLFDTNTANNTIILVDGVNVVNVNDPNGMASPTTKETMISPTTVDHPTATDIGLGFVLPNPLNEKGQMSAPGSSETQYYRYWNVYNNFPVNGVKTLYVVVAWNGSDGVFRRVVSHSVKAGI
jgi:prepilin-type N-terminal cleavage/methylation domain-containing protein